MTDRVVVLSTPPGDSIRHFAISPNGGVYPVHPSWIGAAVLDSKKLGGWPIVEAPGKMSKDGRMLHHVPVGKPRRMDAVI